MAIEEQLLEVILGVISLILTYGIYRFRSQRNEAWVWGDNFLKAAKEKMKLIVALAALYPPVEPLVAKAEKVLTDIEAAWNDDQTTKEELAVYMDDMIAVYEEALKLVESYKKK